MLARTSRDLGLLIRDQRQRLGLAQQELARRIGVSRQWVVEIEAGKPRAELELVMRALSVLDLKLAVRPKVPRARHDVVSLPTASIDLDAVIERARDVTPAPARKSSASARESGRRKPALKAKRKHASVRRGKRSRRA